MHGTGWQGGDAFAQYILAWALLLSPKSPNAFATVNKSALQVFPPALLDGATFFCKGWGVAKGADRRVIKSLERAKKAGHRATLLYRFILYRSGRLGWWRRMLGYAMVPIARLIFYVGVLRNPFSSQAFLFDPSLKVQAFSCWDQEQFEWVPL